MLCSSRICMIHDWLVSVIPGLHGARAIHWPRPGTNLYTQGRVLLLTCFLERKIQQIVSVCKRYIYIYLYCSIFPQIAGSYNRGSNFSKGGIVLANWPTSGCCSECCAGCCQGCCCGCCPGCSGSCLPLGGVRVLSRVLCRGAVQGAPDHVCHWVVSGCCPGSPDHVCHWAVSGCCPGCCQGAPDHVCHWAVSGCCPGCCAGVLFRVLRIMFAIGVSGCCPGCCPGCSGSCLPLGGVRVLSRVLSRGAVEGCCPRCCGSCLPWCCPGCCPVVLFAPDHVCYWAVSGCC